VPATRRRLAPRREEDAYLGTLTIDELRELEIAAARLTAGGRDLADQLLLVAMIALGERRLLAQEAENARQSDGGT
jgi:hypothetical protein